MAKQILESSILRTTKDFKNFPSNYQFILLNG